MVEVKTQEFWRWPETNWVNPDIDWEKGKLITAGVDVGSVSTQAVIMVDDELYAYGNTRTGSDSPNSARKGIGFALEKTDMKIENIDYTPHLDTGDFVVEIPAKKAGPFENSVGKDIIFGIRPENIHDSNFVPPNTDVVKVPVKVDVTELMGNEIFLYLVSGKNTFVSRFDPRSNLRVGQQAEVAFDMDSFHIFDPPT